MDPKFVMTIEEKRIRFKKFFKKKEELAAASNGTESSKKNIKRKSTAVSTRPKTDLLSTAM